MSSDLSNFSMLDLFRGEMESQLNTLNQSLVEIEKDPSQKPLLESLMRAAHSIKGAARIVQIDVIVKVAHALEDYFVALLNGKLQLQADHNDALLKAIDFMAKIRTVAEADLESWQATHSTEAQQCIAEIVRFAAPAGAEVSDRSDSPPLDKGGVRGGLSSVNPLLASPSSEVEESQRAQPAKVEQKRESAEVARSVRINAENLDRIIGLAGESLVAANWLRPFAHDLSRLKNAQTDLEEALERFAVFSHASSTEITDTHFKELRRNAEELRSLISQRLQEFERYWSNSRTISNRLYREALSGRMRPFADGVGGFPRMVRDVSRQLGKQINFEILGKNTPVDREILEKLEAPLNHLVRNSIDHGIEFPEQRVKAGKPAQGVVRLEARHHGGMLHVSVSDDGAGIDYERLRKKILTKRIAPAELVPRMSEEELREFLFLPGFSTSEDVTEISGRGFGLDIVANLARELRGSLECTSETGKGMTIRLQLPLTLSVIRCLLVLISGEPYAFPLSQIERTMMINRSEIITRKDSQYIKVDSQPISVIASNVILELAKMDEDAEEIPVIIIGDKTKRYALIVERFLTQSQVVVRPLDARLGKVQDINSIALMQDGTMALVIDVPDLIYSINNFLTRGRADRESFAVRGAARKKRILVVDDSVTVREVERKILENNGYEVETASDGLDGWNAVRSTHFDLLITDVDMPRMNGIELVGRMKEDVRLYQLPVVIISYKDRDEDKQDALKTGANHFLTKNNFDQETLLHTVRSLLGQNR